MATSFPLKSDYFSGGAHLTEKDAAALASILNDLRTELVGLAALGGPPLESATAHTATFTPAVGNTYIVDTTGGAIGVTLPTATSGDVIMFKNIADSANLLTITAGAGTTIEAYSGFAEVGAAGASTTIGGTSNGRGYALFRLVGTVWRIFNQG
jgi:hypothetical protein